MRQITVLFILFFTIFSYAKSGPCGGVNFQKDPFNPNKKDFRMPFLINDTFIQGFLGFDNANNKIYLNVGLQSSVHLIKETTIPKGTLLRIAFKNEEQLVLKTEQDFEATYQVNGMVSLWILKYELTRDVLNLFTEQKITGIQIIPLNNKITLPITEKYYTKQITKVCKCFNNDEFWDESSEATDNNKPVTQNKESNDESNSDI